MGSRSSLQAAFLGFACLSGSLWYAGRRAEQGVEIAQRAAEVLAPLAAAGDLGVDLEAETPEEGTTDPARASLGKGAQALFDRLELGAGIDPRSSPSSAAEPPPRSARSGPWPKWVDEAPENVPRTVRVRLVDGGSALQSIGRVRVVQRSRGERRDARAYRLSEDDPTLWGIGSPGLLTGAPARFEVFAESHGRTLRGEFHLDAVPAGGSVEVEAPVALGEWTGCARTAGARGTGHSTQ
ncbi:MAG: hypothetical protein AAFP86_05215 [Planctomycetota bacterium]